LKIDTDDHQYEQGLETAALHVRAWRHGEYEQMHLQRVRNSDAASEKFATIGNRCTYARNG
jgi:hypothetical protein